MADAARWVDGAVIRACRSDDEDAVRRVVTAAFAADGPEIAELVDDLRTRHARAELVAEERGEVVGHVLLSRSWVDARRALVLEGNPTYYGALVYCEPFWTRDAVGLRDPVLGSIEQVFEA